MKTKGTLIEFEGNHYLVIHLYSTHQYTQKRVYHILTDNQKYCGNIINIIAGYTEILPKWKRDEIYNQHPCFENYLTPYYEVEFVENKDYECYDFSDLQFPVDTDSYYVLTITYPYDD